MPPPPACAQFGLIVPSFRQGRFLRACLDSLLSQEGVELEFAVWDGGSDDDSVAILESYGARVRWTSAPDGGQVHAINGGLKEISSDLCGYLNSDDVLLPGALEAVARVFAERPDIDVVYGDGRFLNEAGEPGRPYPTLPFHFDHLVQHCFICQPAAFWRRSVHERFGWFNPRFDNTFDYEFWLRLATGGARFLHLPRLLAYSREHPGTKSNRQRARIFAEIRRLQMRHLGYCGRNWWEQQLRFWRDESGAPWARLLPGVKDRRMYRLAWWPYVLWRRKLGGPLFYQPGHWRA